jgi:hypothetical protein
LLFNHDNRKFEEQKEDLWRHIENTTLAVYPPEEKKGDDAAKETGNA